MKNAGELNFQITVGVENAATEDLDQLTRQLLSELKETDVVSAELIEAGPAPAGTKAIISATVGSIAIALLPDVLSTIIDLVKDWTSRGKGRTVKFKGKIGKRQIEFEGSPEQLKEVLKTLEGKKK